MAKRRTNGEGSIRKRKDGRWEGRYTAGRDPMTGKAIYKNVLGKTQAEVAESRSKPKGLSVKTVRNINQVISSAMDFAKEQKLIAGNPTDSCALPKLKRKEMKILLPESLGTFFEEARRSGVFELYYIDLATGLRRGELLELK